MKGSVRGQILRPAYLEPNSLKQTSPTFALNKLKTFIHNYFVTLTSFISLNLESFSTLLWNSLASLQWFLTYSCRPLTPKFLMTNQSFRERNLLLRGIPQC